MLVSSTLVRLKENVKREKYKLKLKMQNRNLEIKKLT